MTPLDCARAYAGQGLYVFPCVMVDMGGARPVKRPAIRAWQDDASTDAHRLDEWWTRWPLAMVGIAHRLTGTMALDIDVKPDADGWLTMLRRRLAGDAEPQTLAFGTASGGAQRVFLRPPALGALSGNFPASLGPGLDAIYGYSVLPSGDATPGRTWVNAPGTLWPAPAPEWVTLPAMARADELAALAILETRAPTRPVWTGPADDSRSMRYVATALDAETARLVTVPYGQRHDAIFRAACALGKACGRADRLDLLPWCRDAIVGAAGWTAKPVHARSIDEGLARGMGS